MESAAKFGMDAHTDVLYFCTDKGELMQRLDIEEHEGLALLQQSLSYKYYGGSHFQNVRHPESGWRLLPFLVIVCPTRGTYFSVIDGVGRIVVRPGEALLVPRGVRHTVAMPEGGVLHHAHIQFSFFGSTDVLHFFDVPPLVKGKAAKAIADVTRDLHAEMEEPFSAPRAVVQAVCRRMLCGLLLDRVVAVSQVREAASEGMLDISRLERPLRYLEENLSGDVCRHELAKLAGLSDTRFHYVFKSATGLSPMAYLRNVRMRKAQSLLLQTDLQVSEVGVRVGYPDVFHFSKVFKSAFHKSPSEYRHDIRHVFV